MELLAIGNEIRDPFLIIAGHILRFLLNFTWWFAIVRGRLAFKAHQFYSIGKVSRLFSVRAAPFDALWEDVTRKFSRDSRRLIETLSTT
jgi:hypothetical protein